MGSIKKALLKLARKVVEGVMQTVMQQGNIMENLIESTIKGFISQITSGAWTGSDADAFVGSVSQTIANAMNPCLANVKKITSNIQTAMDVIDKADSQVRSIVDGLADTFAAVF